MLTEDTYNNFNRNTLTTNRVIVFGEKHNTYNRNIINHVFNTAMLASNSRFDLILSEEIGPYKYFTDRQKKIGKEKELWSICDGTFNLGLKYHIPLVGIDCWDEKLKGIDPTDEHGIVTNFKNSFKIREKQMSKIIQQYVLNTTYKKIAIFIGESHLRKLYTPYIKIPSKITSTLTELSKNTNIIILRPINTTNRFF